MMINSLNYEAIKVWREKEKEEKKISQISTAK